MKNKHTLNSYFNKLLSLIFTKISIFNNYLLCFITIKIFMNSLSNYIVKNRIMIKQNLSISDYLDVKPQTGT